MVRAPFWLEMMVADGCLLIVDTWWEEGQLALIPFKGAHLQIASHWSLEFNMNLGVWAHSQSITDDQKNNYIRDPDSRTW